MDRALTCSPEKHHTTRESIRSLCFPVDPYSRIFFKVPPYWKAGDLLTVVLATRLVSVIIIEPLENGCLPGHTKAWQTNIKLSNWPAYAKRKGARTL